MSFWDEVQQTGSGIKDGFIDLLKGVTDNYVEITKAAGAQDGALASGYDQSKKGVNNMGQSLGQTGNNWFANNWLIVLFVLVLVIALFAAIKWIK